MKIINWGNGDKPINKSLLDYCDIYKLNKNYGLEVTIGIIQNLKIILELNEKEITIKNAYLIGKNIEAVCIYWKNLPKTVQDELVKIHEKFME